MSLCEILADEAIQDGTPFRREDSTQVLQVLAGRVVLRDWPRAEWSPSVDDILAEYVIVVPS